MTPRRAYLLLLAASGLWITTSLSAQGTVRRCSDGNGRVFYTDKHCPSAIAPPPTAATSPAVPNATPSTTPQRFSGNLRPGCARTPDALLGQVTHAVSTGDPNQLANAYHWAGMSNDEGYRVLGRLQTLLARPVMNVSFVYPEVAFEPQDYTLTESGWPITTSAGGDGGAIASPIALRIDQQARATGSTHTLLRLRRYYECWWITF